MINNRTVSREEYLDALNEAKLRFFFRYGSWPDKSDTARQFGWEAESQANDRLFMLEKMRELNVHVGTEATAQMAGDLLEILTGGRAMNAKQALDEFDKQILGPNGMSKSDYARYIRNEVGIMHLISLAGLSGRLVAPQEAEGIYRRENEEVVVELVTFSASNYLASVTNIALEPLKSYFTNHMSQYRLRERVQLSYVKFESTNFYPEADKEIAKITNLNERLTEAYIKRGGTNYYKDKEGKPLTEEAAKAKMKADERDNLALSLARKKSFEFANKLAEKAEKPKLADLKAMADNYAMIVKDTLPFDNVEGPTDIKVMDRFSDLAFALTPEEPVAPSPVTTPDGVYIICLKAKFPSEVPALDTIQKQVTKDYQLSQAEEMARLRGRIFYNSLTNGLAQKKTFTELCLESKQKSLILPAFSRSTRKVETLPPNVNERTVKEISFNLKPGAASQFIPTADGGMILFLRNRFPVDEAKMKTELTAFLSQLRQNRQYDAANEWFGKQRQAMPAKLPESRKADQAANTR